MISGSNPWCCEPKCLFLQAKPKIMDKKDLLKRLEELNNVPVLSKNKHDEYCQIQKDLEELGVPPLSQTLRNESDRQVLLSSFSDGFISPALKNVLTRNSIKTVGDILDLNRLDVLNLSGFGPKKWFELYNIQKAIFNILYSHVDIEDEGNASLPQYTLQQLTDINREMLELEIAEVEGERWNKDRYQELLSGLKKRSQKRAEIYADDEIDEVPVEVLNLSVRVSTLVDGLGIQRIVQIFDITEKEVLEVSNQGKKSWKDIVSLKKEICNSPDSFLYKYNKYYKIRELPETTESIPLYKKSLLAVSQLVEILESRGRKRDAYLVNEFFYKGTSNETITQNLSQMGESLNKERVRQIYVEFQERIMSGSENPLIGNAYFSDVFVDELNSLSQEILYYSLSHANQVFQAPADFDMSPIIRLLGLGVMEITKQRSVYMDAPRIVLSEDSRDFIGRHIKAIDMVMSQFAMPSTKDVIISEVMSCKDAPEKCDINIIERIINNHLWIDVQNGQYTYQYEKLKTDVDQAARIIYEKKRVTTSDIKAIDAEWRNVKPEEGIKVTAGRIIDKFPWVAKGAKNNELVYRPVQMSTIISLREATEKYAKQHIMFKFSDMVNYLKERGYDGYADNSFRVYILKCCVPSNNDKDLLCLESEIQNYPSENWRVRSVQGTVNWVINSCVKLLGKKKMKRSELNKLVISQPEADNYNVRSIYALYLNNHFCSSDDVSPNKLFITEGEYIWVNQQCLDEGLVDLEKVGFRDRRPDYYMDVMTEIVNQLKQACDHRMKMVHLRRICLPLITHPSKITVFYKIINKLPDEVEKIDIDGIIYLHLKTDMLAYEKSYSLPEKEQDVVSTTDTEMSEPEVVETTKPDKIYIRGKIDWGDMASELKRELDYYNRWWDVKGITLEEGVDQFVSLLENSHDEALHGDFSRHIFEFLTQKLDRYDLHDHMKTIVLGAESVIRSLYMQNNSCNSCPKTHGLSDCLALVPELQRWVDDIFAYQSVQKYYDFRKSYLGFYSVRNKFAHGVSIEMNTGNKYQASYCYLALYIYIYCRFLKV